MDHNRGRGPSRPMGLVGGRSGRDLDEIWRVNFLSYQSKLKPMATPRRGRASRGRSVCDIRCFRIFYSQTQYKKMSDLENEGQGHGVQHSQ